MPDKPIIFFEAPHCRSFTNEELGLFEGCKEDVLVWWHPLHLVAPDQESIEAKEELLELFGVRVEKEEPAIPSRNESLEKYIEKLKALADNNRDRYDQQLCRQIALIIDRITEFNFTSFGDSGAVSSESLEEVKERNFPEATLYTCCCKKEKERELAAKANIKIRRLPCLVDGGRGPYKEAGDFYREILQARIASAKNATE
jgi:hypothetical protein